MATVADLQQYLLTLMVRGYGGHAVVLGTREIASIRPDGRTLHLERAHVGDEISHDGTRRVFLRATDEPIL